jgi:transposase
MVRGRLRDRAKELHWRRHLAGWRRSGGSVRAYCQAQGLSEQSFYQWRRVLAQRDAQTAAGPRDSRREPTAFGGGRVRATDSAAPAPQESRFLSVRLVQPAAPVAVEVVLGGGRVLRVAEGFSAQTLRQVVAALEELPC